MATDILRSVLVSRDPETYGGEAVFRGTRVPAVSLVDWLEAGHSLDEYLDNFPSVEREQAIAALELLRQVLLSR